MEVRPPKGPLERRRLSELNNIALCSLRVTQPPLQNRSHPKPAGYLRAAVVQLGFHAAFTPSRGRSWVEDPLGRDALPSEVGRDAQSSLLGLRSRIAELYLEQLRLKVVPILAWCAEWNVDVVVFPEYSLPAQVLPSVAGASGTMVVVAGSHLVDRATCRERIYEALGASASPELGTAISPVLANGKLIACVPKLHPSPIGGEREAVKPGTDWRPVALPPEIPGPMGVLLCIDSIDAEDERVRAALSEFREHVRFWVVPSCTPQTTDFHEQARKQAARYKRPTLYANGSEAGGSGVFVDTKATSDAGLPFQLSAKEEGVLVVDVDLRDTPPGKSTAYDARAVSRIVAAPSLVYTSVRPDEAYSQWLTQLAAKIADPGSTFDRLERAASMKDEMLALRERGALPPTRRRRLEHFANTVDSLTKIEEVESMTAEIVLAPNVLPLSLLEAALCRGARAVVRSWSPGVLDQAVQTETDRELASGSKPLEPGTYSSLTPEADRERKRIEDLVRGEAPQFDEPRRMAQRLQLYSTELQGKWRKDYDDARALLNSEHYASAEERIQQLNDAINGHLAEAPDDDVARDWLSRAQLLRAILYLNYQKPELARREVKALDSERLGVGDHLSLARVWAELDELDQARACLERATSTGVSGADADKAAATEQILALKSNQMPAKLIEEPDLLLRAAQLSLSKGDLAQAVEYAGKAQRADESSLMQLAGAFALIVQALHWSIFELADGARPLAPEEIAAAIATAETWLERLEWPRGGLRQLPLPVNVIDRLEEFRFDYYWSTADPDLAERALRSTAIENPEFKRAMALARDGQTEEALALLPRTDHPWLPELERADFHSLAGDDASGLTLLRHLAAQYPERGPIELAIAEKELRRGDPKAALVHAEQACARVPARGYRWILARCLVQSGHLERAWEILSAERKRGGSNVIHLLAQISTAVHPADAVGLWEQLIERHPENVRIRLELASAQSRVGCSEQAAETAWNAFLRRDVHFVARDLIRCAEFQLAHDSTRLRLRDRVRRIAEVLHERFPGDPEAESYKLHLHLRLGDDPGLPVADCGVLEKHGWIQRFRFENTTQLVEQLLSIGEATSRRQEAYKQFYAVGGIPLATLAELLKQTSAELVKSILEGAGVRVCAALPSSDAPDSLRDLEIVTTDVELLALAKLGLMPRLADALRPGTCKLLLPLPFHERLDQQRERRLTGSASRELVRIALDLVNTGIEQGWVRSPTWVELQENLADSLPDKPNLRAHEPSATESVQRALFETPLHEAIDLAGAVLASPKRWRLSVDFFASSGGGTPEFLGKLEWPSEEHALKVLRFLGAAGRRCITLPHLVRLISPDRSTVSPLSAREHLARGGFPDAFNAAELIEHASEAQLPEEVLTGMEHMARQLAPVVGVAARDYFRDTYSSAIAQAFLGEWPSEDLEANTFTVSLPVAKASVAQVARPPRGALAFERAHLLATTLLERSEALEAQGTTQLQAVMAGVLLHALRDPRLAVEPSSEHRDRFNLSHRTPVGQLLDTVRDWAGPSGSRWAAWGRAQRESWRAIDKFSDAGGPAETSLLALLLASDWSTVAKEGIEPTVDDPSREALAILSSNWAVRPLAKRGLELRGKPDSPGGSYRLDWEALLAHAAIALDESTESEERSAYDERWIRSSVPARDDTPLGSLPLPVEAVLLRTSAETARRHFRQLSELQGRHDGKAYDLLHRLELTPDDDALRREYAQYTVMAPWRLVRDDPSFLMRWPNSHATVAGSPELGDLLSMLHEPKAPVGSVPNAVELVEARFAGDWSALPHDAQGGIYWQLVGLPGLASMLALEQGQYLHNLPECVETALQRSELVQEVPAGLLAQDIIVLRLAMNRSPTMSLPRGTVDLRELAPRAITEIVQKVSNKDSAPGSMSAHEATLLRVCADVSGRFLRYAPDRGANDWLWLTYRLHIWLLAQLGKLLPSLRQEGIEALARLAPPPALTAPTAEPLPDLFNPYFFEARGFDYRLAMVLFALIASDEWLHQEANKDESRETFAPISTPGLERCLIEVASRVPPDCAQAGSWFRWPAPANSTDLATLALVRLAPERVTELPDRSLIARINAWPREFSTLAQAQTSFIGNLVITLSHHIRRLGLPVRVALETKLTDWEEAGTAGRLKCIGLTSLFSVGATQHRDLVWSLVCAHIGDSLAPTILGWYLEGLVRASGCLNEPDNRDTSAPIGADKEPPILNALDNAVQRLYLQIEAEPSASLDHLVLAIARLTIHGESQLQGVARTLLVNLAKRPGFRDNTLLRELVKQLRLAPSQGEA